MSDDALELAVLESFLRDTDFSYLEELVCEAIPDQHVGRAEADDMLRWHSFYKTIRHEFPNLPINEGALDAIWREGSVGNALVGGPEFARWGWYGDLPAAVAAAVLGREGSLEAVLVSGVMLCHGYDYFGGDSRPLIDGYSYLLPALASYTSAASFVPFSGLDVPPGWYDRNHVGPNRIKPNALTRALNTSLTSEQRRAWVSADGASQFYDKVTEQAWLYDFGSVASILDLDMSFLTEQERQGVEEENEGALSGLREYEELSQEDLPLDIYYTAYVVAANTDQLLADAAGCALADAAGVQELTRKHLWLGQWAFESWRYPNCWPEGPWRDAILESSLEDWFVRWRDLPPE